MRRVPSVVAIAVALGALALGPAAFAADEIDIDHVESDGSSVSMLLGVDQLPGGASPDLDSVAVTVDGEAVDASAETVEGGAVERTTVLVLDASNSMEGEKLAAATSAIDSFLEAAPEDVRIGLVTFAGKVQQTIEPTTDHQAVVDALAGVQLAPGTKMYDAVAAATDLAGADGARSLLVLSDGADTGSSTGIDEITTAAAESGVVVDVVALAQSAAQQATLDTLASGAGGQVITADAGALGAVFSAQAQALASQVLVTFELPEGTSGEQRVEATLSDGGATYTDSALVGLGDAAPTAAAPRTVEAGTPMIGRTGFLVGMLAFGLGLAGILAFALGGGAGKSLSDQRLESYFAQSGQTSASGKRSGRPKAEGSLKDAAVGLAGTVVQGDFEDKLAKRLAGAGSPLKPAEWLLLHGAIAIGSAFAGFVLKGGALMAIAFIGGVFVPWWWLKRKHSKRLAAFNAQLAETLTLMAGGLSAGLSLPQAVDTVVREGHQPMAGELGRALVEQRLGIPIEETLENVAERMESEDFSWVVMAIRIQREVGGNLAELLNTVSETLRDREYLRRQVRVLSAEGRFSGYVLTGLPIALFCYMLVFKGDFVKPLYTTGTGYVMCAVAIGMLAAGSFVMSRLTKIKV
ncbi:tight adherence protein B [Nocardioides cavernae]|uniref:Tight adherence protein B n=1 Tax=Nocardioides cavernae TaxID=1921566 RepID=A0A7Y9H6P4_9ACTN|nr:type II secretion system F family protein [Nocardioides cavernae]NYE38910.1 tight adherence protein B [Nocardioides cavernae]